MIRVISSPSSSTIGFSTLIFVRHRGAGDPTRCRTMQRRWQRAEPAHREHPRGLQPGRRRWPTTTSSRPTAPLARRCGARAPTGPRTGSRARRRARRLGADRSTLGAAANENPPKLRTHDRFGNRVDEVEFHPAWHELLGLAVEHELHSSPWKDPQPGAHVARGAAFMCMSQAEAGIGCPISMTYSVIPALRAQPELAAEWEPRFLSSDYDPRNAPGDREARRPRRDGDDREAGRLRRARQHHRRPAGERRRPRGRVRADRPQVVHVGADVRRLPRPRPGRRRHLLLPLPALDPRRRAQPLPPPAAQGQARQPLQRLQRDRVRRRLGLAGRRGGRRRADDHRDGQPHPARLRDRRRHRDARRGRAGDPPRRPPLGLRHDADRPAADAQRARRPLRRVGGGDGLGDAPGPRLRRGDRRRRRRRRT